MSAGNRIAWRIVLVIVYVLLIALDIWAIITLSQNQGWWALGVWVILQILVALLHSVNKDLEEKGDA